MQLILDAETTTIDIQSKMSAVEQESFNEKFANNIIENFSNDSVSNSDENITPAQTTVISDIEEIFGQDKINNETHKPESNNISINGDCDSNKSDEITSSEFNETLTKISDTCITEINESKENANHDKNISQCSDYESQSESSNQSLEEKSNLCQSKPDDLLNKDINKLEVNIAESSESIKENACFSDKDSTDVNEKATESGTENVKINNSETDVPKNSQNVDMLENFKEQNDDNVFRIEQNNIKNAKSVCSTLNTKDFDSTAEQTLNTEDILVLSEQNEVSSNSTMGIISEKDLKSTCAKNCNESINVDEAYLDGEQGVEIKQISLNNDHQSETQFIEKIGVQGNVDELKKNNVVEGNKKIDEKKIEEKKKSSLICKLSNTLDILSDDEDEQPEVPQSIPKPNNDNQCLSVEDDDDIMLIDEDICAKKDSVSKNSHTGKTLEHNDTSICNENICSNEIVATDLKNESATEKPVENLEKSDMRNENKDLNENLNMRSLLPGNFLKTCKKNLADMTREDLEEFCILKIVESVVDRSSLGDIKTQLKTMALTVEEYKKKAMMLTKQNRDLQVVLKSIQEEQKKAPGYPITPLKITRSVGMQVLMTDKAFSKRKNILGINSSPTLSSNVATEKLSRNTLQKSQKNTSQQIPVPRLVPAANNTATKSNTTQTNTIAPGKPQQTSNALPKSVSNSPPTQKPEKRPRQLSVTVDLTDDEPPTKMASKSSPAAPVRLVPPQNLMAPQRPQFGPIMNSPRKVYIPISGPQAQNVRPGQTIMLKTVPPNSGPRQKVPPTNNLAKMQSNTIRMSRVQSNRHPAPLPDAMKQYQPPNWKALPPAPDLKLSKVENGIVISWKIDGYQDDSYEEIASYQLYAYQETTSPPSTALWKKIGDVKALPLPMACTLTQFMAGYKYYFAVRAVDVKSRLGPFSLPGSILLLNKM
ncbi:unnamed protein product [Parnassius mnemosyne]|uniref:Activating transcription factor 7-interacting protein Fn3 domain-containing protein n=1 Tax=Parnassius mnemosyne TaxID=213953 RepID=A0AAV1KTU5_9NEOP